MTNTNIKNRELFYKHTPFTIKGKSKDSIYKLGKTQQHIEETYSHTNGLWIYTGNVDKKMPKSISLYNSFVGRIIRTRIKFEDMNFIIE